MKTNTSNAQINTKFLNDYEEKQDAKRERYLTIAQKLEARAGAVLNVGPNHYSRDWAFITQPGHIPARAQWQRKQERALGDQRKAQYYRDKAESIGKGGISSDNPDASEKLTERLAKLELDQERMKAANFVVRAFWKHGNRSDNTDDELAMYFRRMEEKAGIKNTTVARKLLEPDFCGRRGFADYMLTNNSANIRRIKQRIKELSAKPTETIEREAGSVTVRENADDNRLWLVFPGKPADNIRATLKQSGFRWSPERGAWVRQLNNGARAAAEYVLKQVNS